MHLLTEATESLLSYLLTINVVYPDSLSKCYGTLYKRNVSSWINMNLFILEETLDPLSVRVTVHSIDSSSNIVYK